MSIKIAKKPGMKNAEQFFLQYIIKGMENFRAFLCNLFMLSWKIGIVLMPQ